MVSHYDAKKPVKKQNVDKDTLTAQGTYSRWTESGLECEALNNDCFKCPLFTQYGMHKESKNRFTKCFQVDVNTHLKAMEIKPFIIQETFKDPYRKKRASKAKTPPTN